MFIKTNNHKIDVEIGRAIREINNWCIRKDKYLNIISVPYNSSSFFAKIILDFANIDKKILYITEEQEERIEIIENLKKNSDFREYYYYRNDSYNSKLLTICSTDKVCSIDDKFDLVIYNDVNGFSRYDNNFIIDIVNNLLKSNGKAIFYSIEQIHLEGDIVLLPAKENKMPICEPRIITTRIDLEKEIPFVIYDYINWFISSDRKVIIYTPDGDKVMKIYNYLFDFRKKLSVNLNYYIQEKIQCSPRMINRFVEQKSGILITDCYDRLCLCMNDVDVMVFFADDKRFTYKQLVYFCNKTKRGDKVQGGEVIFLANENTRNMEKARQITRNFNVEAWEKGLLNI